MNETDVKIEALANRYVLNAMLALLEDMRPGANEVVAKALLMVEDAERLRDRPDSLDARAIGLALKMVQGASARPTLTLVPKD